MTTLLTRTKNAARHALQWADNWTLLAFNAGPALTH